MSAVMTFQALAGMSHALPYHDVIASVLDWLVVAALFAGGSVYLASKRPMPYHLKVLDVPWSELTPRTQFLMLTLMKGTGLAGIGTAVAMAVLLTTPFRAQAPWARWAILLVGGTPLVPLMLGALGVRMKTAAPSPWLPLLALIVALVLACWLSA